MKRYLKILIIIPVMFMASILGTIKYLNPCNCSNISPVSNCLNPGELMAAEVNGNKKSVKKYKVTFIELGSVNCVPCKMMQPVVASLEKEYSRDLKVIFYDVWTDEGAKYGRMYNVAAIPTQVFLDENGHEFYRHTGFFPKEEIVKIIRAKGVTN